MAKPLGQEAVTTPIHEQVREAMRQAHTDRMAPIGIIFSQAGYTKAQGQSVPGMQAFTGGQGQHHVATHYLGLPLRVDPPWDMTAEFRLELVPGGSYEAKQFRASRGLRSVNQTFDRSAVRVTAKGPMDKPTIEVLAEGLTKPQLCDLIDAWCAANPADAMAAHLTIAVQTHGRFE